MRYNGKIAELNHIVISDPSYGKDVTCRYEKTGMNEKDWKIDIDIENVEDRYGKYTFKGTEFYIFLVKDRINAELRYKGTIKCLSSIKIKETEIGMDTACVAFGINEKADEIIEVQDIWQPEESIKTLTDGLFGTVKEGTKNGEPVFIWISGYITDDAGYSESCVNMPKVAAIASSKVERHITVISNNIIKSSIRAIFHFVEKSK